MPWSTSEPISNEEDSNGNGNGKGYKCRNCSDAENSTNCNLSSKDQEAKNNTDGAIGPNSVNWDICDSIDFLPDT
jgi:hypothetical protein